MNRGVARQTTFFSDEDRIEFERLLGVASDRSGVEVHAFCLMPNHFHLILRCPEGGLSAFVQLLIAVFTRHTNDRVGRDGPLFRGRFRSRSIGDDRYLRAAVRYVHRNPLALPGVGSVEHYRWSSHRSYLVRRRATPWLVTAAVLELFGDDVDLFHRFVANDEQPTPGPLDAFRLEEAVWLVVEEVAGELDRAPQGLVRTVTNLVLDASEPGRTSPALRRARRQAQADPILIEAAARAMSLAA